MNVKELSPEQLQELRINMFYPNPDEFDDEEELFEKCVNAIHFSDITDEMIFEHYGHISFVPDDFACSVDSED